MSRLGSALVSIGSLALVGCVLLVSPERFGDTCRFNGADTQCGACIAAHCQEALNDCCRDEACDPTLRTVESCASLRDDTCGAIANDASRFTVASCVVQSCSGVCVALHGTSQTSCKEPFLADGTGCTCSYVRGGGNDFVCSGAAYPETICCASSSWPAVGLECACRPVDCTPNAEGCICLTVDAAPEQRECGGMICCQENDSCLCGSKPCLVGFQTHVPSCDIAHVGCRMGEKRVDSCSLRAP